VRLRDFVEKLQRLERTYGSDLPVELANGVAALPPVINPVTGRYSVVIYGSTVGDQCEGPDDCDAHHPCLKHASETNSMKTSFKQR